MNIEKHETVSKKRKNIIKKAVLLTVLLICIICYIAVPSIHNTINRVFEMFKSGDFMVVKDFVKSYGPYAAVISFLLMILQSIAAPLPSFLITFANANLFGWVKGAILSWTSAMVGATLCFYIARILGRDAVEKLTSRRGLARLLPFISFDIVSYAAGLTSISFLEFIVATGLGQLPATIIYSYVGGMLTGGAKLLVTGLFILFGVSGIIFLIRQVYIEKNKEK